MVRECAAQLQRLGGATPILSECRALKTLTTVNKDKPSYQQSIACRGKADDSNGGLAMHPQLAEQLAGADCVVNSGVVLQNDVDSSLARLYSRLGVAVP